MGFDAPIAQVTGLAAGDIAAQAANVQFSLVRPAGTIKFEGRFAESNGAGNFRFTPSDGFVREMDTLGLKDFTDQELLVLAAHDFAPQMVRDLRALGYDLATRKEVVEIAIFRITAATVREFARLGYSDLTLRELVDMRVGRVDAAFVSGMKELGYNLAAREIANLAILGVTPAYIRELKSAGLTGLSAREAESLKIGRITPKRIDEYRRLGYTLDPKQLADFGIHGVTPEFIKEVEAAGYANLSVEDLVAFRIHGVTPGFIKAIQALGFKPSAEQLVALRIHNVTPEFIEAVKSRGFKDATLDQIIELRRLNIIPGQRKP